MNCPNCGAENDADARFCAECGTPLDDVVVKTPKVEQVFDETNEDMTIISASSEAVAEAKPLAVDQAEVVATVEEVDNTEEADDDSTLEPESSSPPLEPASAGAGGDDQNGDTDGGDEKGEGGSNRTLIIVGVIVLVVLLLCCCCSVLIGVAIGSDQNVIENLTGEMSMLPVYLPLI